MSKAKRLKGRKRRDPKRRRESGKSNGLLRSLPEATVTMYGHGGNVEYIAVAIHVGSRLVDSRFFESIAFPSEAAMTEAIGRFISSHRVSEVKCVDGVLTPEFGEAGNRTVRIADRHP